jgi:hypothetical protein
LRVGDASLKVAGSQQVSDTLPQLGGHINRMRLGFQLHPAAVSKFDNQLQRGTAWIASHDFMQLLEGVSIMLLLIEPDDDALGQERIDLVQQDHIVDDQVWYFPATPPIGIAPQ